MNVPEKIRGFHVMVAGVDIPVVFHGQRSSTRGRMNTQAVLIQVSPEGDIEHLNEDRAHVSLHPFIENGRKKLAVRPPGDGAGCDEISILSIEDASLGTCVLPPCFGRLDMFHRRTFDDGNELQILRSEFVA